MPRLVQPPRALSLPARLEALGFGAAPAGEGIYVLCAEGRPAAAVRAYPTGRDLDRAAAGGELPVAGLLRQMEASGVEKGHPRQRRRLAAALAEHPARMTRFMELDLRKLSDPGYIGALLSARALRRDGLAAAIAGFAGVRGGDR